jgi:ribosomal protein L11 methyltransferase
MDYIEVECTIEPYDATISEILVAGLAEIGYESFVDLDNGLQAYIRMDQFDEKLIYSFDIMNNTDYRITIKHKKIQEENWNETWEKNYFEPIIIEDECVVRSSFHPEFPDIRYQITIDPKMAFGTGHHETTSLIIKEILEMEFEGRKVADFGCGTGILAILAAMRGANNITAVDIDEWSYNNTIENIKINNCSYIKVLLGNVSVVKNEKFDVVFANINKNVLLGEMHDYANCMNKGSILLLSGFYQSDSEDIDKKCRENGLLLLKQNVKNNWTLLKYSKSND